MSPNPMVVIRSNNPVLSLIEVRDVDLRRRELTSNADAEPLRKRAWRLWRDLLTVCYRFQQTHNEALERAYDKAHDSVLHYRP